MRATETPFASPVPQASQTFHDGVGVDAVKFVRRAPIYLPDVKNYYNGWNSTLGVRSNGGNAFVDMKFYDQYGGFLATQTNINLAGRGVWEVPAGLSGFFGSVVVDASQDVSVVALGRHDGYSAATAYTGRPAAAAGPTAYLPALYQIDTLTSDFAFTNVSTAATTIQGRYYDRNGVNFSTLAYWLPTLNTLHQNTSSLPNFEDGAAHLTANPAQPIVAVGTTLWQSAGVPFRTSAYTAPTVGYTTLYAPSVYRIQSGASWTHYSAIILQNLAATTANVTLRFYPRGCATPCQPTLTLTDTIPPYAAHGYNTKTGGSLPPDMFAPLGPNWDGAVVVTAGQLLAGVSNTLWESWVSAGSYTLSGPADSRGAVIFPVQFKQATGSTGQRWSAVNILNTGAEAVNATITFYWVSGDLALGPLTATLQPNQAWGLNTRTSAELSSLPTTFQGSAVVTGNRPTLVGIANLIYTDATATYEGIGR